MGYLRRVAAFRLTSDSLDVRIGQLVCFAAGPGVLYFAARALERHASTPGELVVGLLAAVAVMLLCILLGLTLGTRR